MNYNPSTHLELNPKLQNGQKCGKSSFRSEILVPCEVTKNQPAATETKHNWSLRALVNLRPQFGCWPIRREPPWTLTETPQTDASMGWAWSNSVTRFDRWTLRNSPKQWIYIIYIYIYLCSGGGCGCCCCCLLMRKINPCIPACQDMFFRVAVASYSIGIIPAMEHGTKTGKNIIRDALLYIYTVGKTMS